MKRKKRSKPQELASLLQNPPSDVYVQVHYESDGRRGGYGYCNIAYCRGTRARYAVFTVLFNNNWPQNAQGICTDHMAEILSTLYGGKEATV